MTHKPMRVKKRRRRSVSLSSQSRLFLLTELPLDPALGKTEEVGALEGRRQGEGGAGLFRHQGPGDLPRAS